MERRGPDGTYLDLEQGCNATYQEMLTGVRGPCRDLCEARLPHADTGLAQSAKFNPDEGEATNSLESKAWEQNGIEELKKELEILQEAIHQGLWHSAELENNQMSKKEPPRIRKFFREDVVVGVKPKLKVSGQHQAVVECLMSPLKPTGTSPR